MKHVALFNHNAGQFVQMQEGGRVGVLDDARVTPLNLEPWRTWERFLVVDAGGGTIALHCAAHNRFLRADGDGINAFGGPRDACDLPGDWASERFTLVDAGAGRSTHTLTQTHSLPLVHTRTGSPSTMPQRTASCGSLLERWTPKAAFEMSTSCRRYALFNCISRL